MQRRYTVLLTLLCTLAANLPATSASAQERPIQAVLASDASQTCLLYTSDAADE